MVFSRIVKLHQEQPTKLVLFAGLSSIKPQLPMEETLPDPVFTTALSSGPCLQTAPSVLHPPQHLRYSKFSEKAATKHELYSTWQNISSTPQPTQGHPEILGNLAVGYLSLFLKMEKWNKLFLDKDIY